VSFSNCAFFYHNCWETNKNYQTIDTYHYRGTVARVIATVANLILFVTNSGNTFNYRVKKEIY